jgi:hypothetical protein
MRSLPQHSYAKLKQRDDKSLVLTFLDWALIPLSGLDVRFWHIGPVSAVQRHVWSWGKTGSNRTTVKMALMTRMYGPAARCKRFSSIWW